MLFLIMLLISPVQADEGKICGVVSNANDILECVKTRSPQLQSFIQEKEAVLSEAKATRRWLNPVVNNQTMFGKNLGNDQYQIQVGVLQPIEFGAKRGFKNTLASSLEKRAQADFQVDMGQELIQTGSDLVRLIQIRTEIASVEEAIAAFSRLIAQFGNRPRLSPEQEVSASVYKLSRGDFLVRQNALIRERQEILIRFKSKLDVTEESVNRLASGLNLSFPEVGMQDFPEGSSPEISVVEADVTAALANVNLAQGDIFSDFLIGPMVQFDVDGPFKSQMYGLQLSIPLPLWNQNGYGIEAAAKRLKSAEIQASIKKNAVREEWKLLIQNYSRLRTLLKEVPTTEDIEARHRKVENQIVRGLITSALVVESHRSLIDMQKSRHESEIAALSALWHIYIIQGKIAEIKL